MKKYYILSLKWSEGCELATWWKSDNSGYTRDLNEAGVYTEEQIQSRPHYYDNGVETKAISIDELEKVKKIVSVKLDDLIMRGEENGSQ